MLPKVAMDWGQPPLSLSFLADDVTASSFLPGDVIINSDTKESHNEMNSLYQLSDYRGGAPV